MLFHGARSGLEMLYQNKENDDFGLYYDQPTFKAFASVSPRPALRRRRRRSTGACGARRRGLVDGAGARTHVYIAGPEALLPLVDKAMAAGRRFARGWEARCAQLKAEGRWHEVLY